MKARRRIDDVSRASSLTGGEESQQRQVHKRRRQPWNNGKWVEDERENRKRNETNNGGWLKCEEEKGKRGRDA